MYCWHLSLLSRHGFPSAFEECLNIHPFRSATSYEPSIWFSPNLDHVTDFQCWSMINPPPIHRSIVSSLLSHLSSIHFGVQISGLEMGLLPTCMASTLRSECRDESQTTTCSHIEVRGLTHCQSPRSNSSFWGSGLRLILSRSILFEGRYSEGNRPSSDHVKATLDTESRTPSHWGLLIS